MNLCVFFRKHVVKNTTRDSVAANAMGLVVQSQTERA
jgi:hypothetical protein